MNIFIMNRYISKSYTRSKNTIYRAAAVVSIITSYTEDIIWPHGDTKSLFACRKTGRKELMGLGLELQRSSPVPLSAVRGRKWRRLGGGRFGFIALHL